MRAGSFRIIGRGVFGIERVGRSFGALGLMQHEGKACTQLSFGILNFNAEDGPRLRFTRL